MSRFKKLVYRKIHGFPASNVQNYGVISIVVPCYNVAPYLEKCLRSILDQEYPFIEVVVVDDGSPDNSYEIAKAVARTDRRVKIVRQENKGLGGARNTGVRESKGRFITFVDSDDTISASGYLTMAKTLDKTGSDFVVGTMQRQLGDRRWVPKWAVSVHAKQRLKAALADDPSILQDVFVCNKLFRREFWNAKVGAFPEGIRYEDQEPTARAYTSASSFDVISDIVYTWVIREDGTSITQGKANIDDLRDRLKVMASVKAVLETQATQEVFTYWQAKSIGFDLESYFDQIPRTNTKYWEELQQGITLLAEGMTDLAWSKVSFHNRVKAQAALLGRREDIALILANLQEQKRSFGLQTGTQGATAYSDYLEHLSFEMPRNLLQAKPADLTSVFKLLAANWTDAGDLDVQFLAYVPGLATDGAASLKVSLQRIGGDGSINNSMFTAVPMTVLDADDLSNDAYASHQNDGFVCTIPASWFEQAAEVADAQWQMELHLSFGEIQRSGAFNSRSNLGNAVKFHHARLIQGRRVALSYKAGAGLTFRVVPDRPVIDSLSVDGREVEMTFSPEYFERRSIRRPYIEILNPSTGTKVHPIADPSNSYKFRARLPELDESAGNLDRRMWRLKAGASESRSYFIELATPTHELAGVPVMSSTLVPDHSPNGYLRFLDVPAAAEVTDLSLQGGEITVQVRIKSPLSVQSAKWALISTAGHRLEAVVEQQSSESVTLRFLTNKDEAGVRLSEESGGYSLRLILDEIEYWLPMAPQVVDLLPLYDFNDFNRLRASRTPKAGALWIRIDPPLAWNERGAYMQRKLILESRARENAQLIDGTLFESYGGKNCSDTPYEVSKQLFSEGRGGEHFWTVKDLSIRVPSGTTPLLLNSRKYHQVLSKAKTLVNNNNFPFYFRKNEGQKYIQTWHGTPLKKIGNDVPAANLSISYRELMLREADSWDVLIAQNEFAAEQLPKSFGYEGRVLTSGYPRNDILNSPEADSIRLSVRRSLELTDDQLVVLYAPTWRDNKKTTSNHYALVSYLEADLLQKSVQQPLTVLTRGHSNTSSGRTQESLTSVVDVTDYPNVNDLYLACDVLITDYSSVMFDYVNTGKPIIFLVPDLKEYSGEVRGFYLDLEALAPGPLVSSTEEIVPWLNDVTRLKTTFRQRYVDFCEQFTALDDGHAAERVAAEWPEQG